MKSYLHYFCLLFCCSLPAVQFLVQSPVRVTVRAVRTRSPAQKAS